MTEPTYLFDASSVVKALKEAKLLPLGGQAVQWLTIYEVLNAFWKEAYLLRRLNPEEALFLAETFAELLKEMFIFDPRNLEQEVLRTALSKRVTVYDASYIALAAKHGLTLVTEDKELARTAKSMIKVTNLDELTHEL